MAEIKELKQEDLENVNGGLVNCNGYMIYQNFNMMLVNIGDNVNLYYCNPETHRYELKEQTKLDNLEQTYDRYYAYVKYNNETIMIDIVSSSLYVDGSYAIGPIQ